MIIFFEKNTGKIIGTIEGRIHGEIHLNQWIGDKKNISRFVIQWKKNENGLYEPDLKDKIQKNIAINIDKNPINVYNYIISINKKGEVLGFKEKN